MKITLIAGGNRAQASSTRLLRHIEERLLSRQIEATFVDLYEWPLPLFSADNWDFHPNVRRMLEAVAEADGLVLATPEYHGSLSGVLKNALDYMNPDLVAGKTVLSVSSAGGPLGVSSLTHLQTIVRNLHGVNSPEWISIGGGANSFGPDGVPTDEATRARVEAALGKFLELTGKLAARTPAVN
ncbi:FMN reductase [Cohnella xylanilytica]|uniref:NAD(P)H-dependent oxidoreductase n=1 Tax=Cohnella xylanilytica TaxID=557555 RepID=A0A841U769_9BACL|nr:NADPH-dependent FMN reductase [Cohnella xylanilytica]MBB6693861.1 NAD(P)H-dependent oxidoreductase [Cohnella xylanilytica]GIO14092.1 FMN reductase [Cohnella xylanilytica]